MCLHDKNIKKMGLRIKYIKIRKAVYETYIIKEVLTEAIKNTKEINEIKIRSQSNDPY